MTNQIPDKPQRFEVPDKELRARGVLPETFEAAYAGAPAWEIGRPQPFVEELIARNALHGRVLDIGCGTGENSLLLAQHGCDVVGFDIIDVALRKARQKVAAAQLQAKVSIVQASVFDIDEEFGEFDCALDSGTFHVFSDRDQARYAAAIRARLKPAGRLFMISFSEHETRPGGPRRLKQFEIANVFCKGWKIESIEPSTYAATAYEGGASAWLAIIQRKDS